MGIEPTHVGITTRGLTTWLQTPYRNTFNISSKLALRTFRYCQVTEHWPRSLAVTVRQKCFYMVGALGFEPRIGRLKVCCDNRFTIPRIVRIELILRANSRTIRALE